MVNMLWDMFKQTKLKTVRSKNLNTFRKEIERLMKYGYFAEWRSFRRDEREYIIFMVRP